MRAQQVGCFVLPSLNRRFYLFLKGNSLSGQALFLKISMSTKRATRSPKGHVTPNNFSCNLQRTDDEWKTFQVAEGVSHLCNFFSQLATRTITNKMADALSKRKMSSAHSDKIALQVAEGMLHASNLSCNVAKRRGSFSFSCNSQRNNCSCKMGCYTWSFACNLQRNVCCVANCKKNCFV